MSSNGQRSFLPSLKLGPRTVNAVNAASSGKQPRTARAILQDPANKEEPGSRVSLPANPHSARVHKAAEPNETQPEEADSLDAGVFNVSTSTVASCPALQITAPPGGSLSFRVFGVRA